MILWIFSPGHFAQRAPVHGEVLREEAHLFPVDGAETCDDTVGISPFTLSAALRPAARQHVEFLEGPGVEEVVNALSSRHLAARVLAFYGGLATRVQSRLAPAFEFFQLFLHRLLATADNASALLVQSSHGKPSPWALPTSRAMVVIGLGEKRGKEARCKRRARRGLTNRSNRRNRS